MADVKRASEQPRWLISTLSLLLAACTLLVYFQVRSHDFLRIDDTDYVVHNANVCTGLSADNVTWAFTRSHSSNWHPLTWISHMVDCELFGLNAGAHLLVNVGFHIGSTLFLFLVLRRLTNSIWRSLLVAGLFALHPLHVESVAWVAERKDVLSAFFFMLTLWAYTGYAQVKGRPQAARPAAARKAWLYYAAALLCFALGLMSKGMLVTLPFVLLLLDFWPLRRFQQGRVLPIVLEKMPFFVLTILCSVITFVVQQKSGAVVALEHVSLGERVSNAVVSYVEYLRLMIAPSGLSVFYPPKAVAGWEIGLSLALLVAVTAVGLKTWRSHPYILTGWFWYLGMLVPVIGIVKVGDQAYADRYTYLPSIGIFLLVAWAAGDLVTHWRSLRKPMAVAWVTVLCVLALLTHRQASYWKNTWLLYSHASEVTTNNFMAMMVMGTLLAEEGKTQEGRALIDAGLRIAPGHPDMNSGLGLMLLAEKKFAEAQPYFERALAKVPDLQQAQYGLAVCNYQQGDFAAAEAGARRVLLNGNNFKAQLLLAMTLAMQDRKSEAETAYHQLLIIKPGLAAGLSGLANVLLSQGRSLEAAQLFIKAVESDPRNTECLNGWAAALAQQNQLSSAVAKYSESLKIDPNQPVVHCAIADLATGLGETEKSVHHYREALRLEPAMGLALNNLAWILATHPDAHYRDGKEAVRLSQLACKQTDYKLPFLIGTLAAAQAEAGEFEAAIASAEMARDLAISNGQPEVAKKNEELLVLYRSGRAYRESSRGH